MLLTFHPALLIMQNILATAVRVQLRDYSNYGENFWSLNMHAGDAEGGRLIFSMEFLNLGMVEGC